jgi:hypothetical protein
MHLELALRCWRNITGGLMKLTHISLRTVSHLSVSVWLSYFTQQIVLDPVLKLEYLKAAWDDKYLHIGMDRFKEKVWLFFCIMLE